MPIYQYGCSECGEQTTVMAKMSDPAPATCPACGAEGTLTKAVSRAAFHLKGGGWYAQGYNSAGSAKPTPKAAPASTSSSDD